MQLPGPGKASGQRPIQSPGQRKCRYRSLSDISRASGLVSRSPGAESGEEMGQLTCQSISELEQTRQMLGDGAAGKEEGDPRSGQQPRGALQGGHGEVRRAHPAPCGSPTLGHIQGPLPFGGGAQNMLTGRKLWHVPRCMVARRLLGLFPGRTWKVLLLSGDSSRQPEGL